MTEEAGLAPAERIALLERRNRALQQENRNLVHALRNASARDAQTPMHAVSDIIYGQFAIQRYLDIPTPVLRDLIAKKHVPTFKIQGAVCARRSELNSWVATRGRPTLESKEG